MMRIRRRETRFTTVLLVPLPHSFPPPCMSICGLMCFLLEEKIETMSLCVFSHCPRRRPEI